MDFNTAAFQEPRGVMRILHFIFSICAFATITSFSGENKFSCGKDSKVEKAPFDYPFNLNYNKNLTANNTCPVSIYGDFSSDAKFFVTTGVLAMLYVIGIIIVYAKFDQAYKTNSKLPLLDFIITVVFSVLWLSSSAAWAHGLTGLKSVTDPDVIVQSLVPECSCKVAVTSFSTLNISVIFGFLNFVIWTGDLWFLYKETAWFQGNQLQTTSGV